MTSRLLGVGSDSMAVAQQPLMFRNKIINGNFDIWQRGTSQATGGYGSDDRWNNDNVGSTKTHSRQTFAPGQTDVPGNPTYFSRTTVVSSVVGAANRVLKSQKIEGVHTFAGQTVTLSFWAKADASKNIAIEFAQNFGTGGSPSTVVTFGTNTSALTSSWKKFTITLAIPSISGKAIGTNNDDSLQLFFWFDAGSNFNARTNSLGQQSGTFDIAQIQLEQGGQATAFEQRPIGTELALCQRYFYKSSTFSCGTTIPAMFGYSPMRGIPVPTITNLGGAGTVTFSYIGPSSFRYSNSEISTRDFVFELNAEL